MKNPFKEVFNNEQMTRETYVLRLVALIIIFFSILALLPFVAVVLMTMTEFGADLFGKKIILYSKTLSVFILWFFCLRYLFTISISRANSLRLSKLWSIVLLVPGFSFLYVLVLAIKEEPFHKS
ncbi:hypothetical protein [Bacteriovorax sp. DB6_IX]|uniref:hypothetical protein n=1 Tax=Bacteriovorax sp. DB6_IX TaxID=1353530 RepID=UPI00038A116E|nr:hypothetical protein [Bacteriovorax sp. DB6_IX]EQC52108.1 hypothetical protein M901_0752 [Bacteriovorax sp. DB6_IX]